jgi:acetyl esterase/lipase
VKVLAVVAGLWIAAVASAVPGAGASAGMSGGLRPGVPSVTGVTYCTDGGQPLGMTLFRPPANDRVVPVVLQVHGGAWEHGVRWTSLSQSNALASLVGSGVAVASIDYRLAPADPWPDQIEDVMCAARFLRAHARQFGIDPSRVGAWGSSAGGQLVSLLATAPDISQWKRGQYQGESSSVQAVVDEFGPADLAVSDWGAYVAGVIRTVFHTEPDSSSAVLKAASPLNHVAPGDPPFLILQGTADRIVPADQSERLAQHLAAAHVPAKLVLVNRGMHGLKTSGEHPSPAQLDTDIVSYFVSVLRQH